MKNNFLFNNLTNSLWKKYRLWLTLLKIPSANQIHSNKMPKM